VVDGVATVDLNKPAREANAVQRLMLKNQLERTLSGPDQTAVAVSSVNVTVEQQVFEMQVSPSPTSDAQGSAPGPAGPQPPPDVDGPLVGLDAKGAIVRLDGGKAVPVKGLAVPASPTNTSPATETGGGAYAVLVDGRKRLVYAVPSGPTTTLVRGNGLLPPSFDPFGWVWTAQEQAGDVVIAALPGSGVSWVQASWLGGARLRSLRISPEGARAVLVAQRPAGATQVFVCSVVRDGKGRPIALGPPHLLLAGEQQVISAAWAGDTHVAVLVRGSGQLVQPWVVELGGDAEQATEVEGVAWISAGHGPQDLYATTATGAVRMLTAAGWQDVAGIRWASLPG
jgi:Lipoprotein LpqB beta-propeller domain